MLILVMAKFKSVSASFYLFYETSVSCATSNYLFLQNLNNKYEIPVNNFIAAGFVESVVKAKRLVLEVFRKVDFLFWFVNNNNVFVWNSHNIYFLTFQL